ncbi:hypothetical protein KAR91_43620 [Candidatus Pacearchaeota archaeon]|nr:hypothetical protein [Candidatus Pacearchaeota archaeon]
MLNNYRAEITKVDNGFTVRIDNDNHISKVFSTIEEVFNYLRQFFA